MRNIISVLFATALVATASVPSAEQYRVSGLEQFGATGGFEILKSCGQHYFKFGSITYCR